MLHLAIAFGSGFLAGFAIEYFFHTRVVKSIKKHLDQISSAVVN